MDGAVIGLRARRLRGLFVLVVLSVLFTGARDHCFAGSLEAGASCADSSSISVHWTFYDDPLNPVAYPEWVGYDVMRRSLSECGPYVRVNADPLPRVVGATHSHVFTEAPPARRTTYEYRVIPVDAQRQPVIIDRISCDNCGLATGWASCPERSAPLTQGTLEDWGWTLFVHPCPDGCYPGFYLADHQAVVELRPYAGTGTTLSFYGRAACGSVEGCAISIDRYEEVPCGPTPVARPTWGRLKLVYRSPPAGEPPAKRRSGTSPDRRSMLW